MDVFLDIGFTLLGGPDLSPPKKMRQVLGLDESFSAALSRITFSEDHTGPDSLIHSIEKAAGIKATGVQQDEIHRFWAAQYTDVYEIDGASALLDFLIERRVGIHIVSNLWFPFYDRFREVFSGKLAHIKTETLSFREGITKPSLDLYRIALERAGASPSGSIMVGDSLDNDIHPCARLGMRCIWFISRPMDGEALLAGRAELAGYNRIYEAASLHDVRRITERTLIDESE